MSLELEFDLKEGLPLDASCLLPEKLLQMGLSELMQLRIRYGRGETALGNICRMHFTDDGEDVLILKGNTRLLNRVGYGMSAGNLRVAGSLGQLAGAEMSGGCLEVNGGVGDLAGASMTGGQIRILGSAGGLVGGQLLGRKYGMNGGEIYIWKNSGAKTGSNMRRGLIVVQENSGDLTGYRMLAGTIMVFGRMGKHAGLGMRRGSLVAGSSALLVPGFKKSCKMDLTWLRIYFRYLKNVGIEVPERWKADQFHRLIGHFTDLGRGEVLLYESPE